MNKRKIVSMIAVALCVAAATSAVLAQGRYANVYSRGDVDGFIRNLETSSDVFSRDFKNTGGVSSTERRTVDRFENAVDRLRSRFNGNNNNWWQSRAEVQGIMNEARQVNVMMNNDRYGRPLESQWRNLRRDINKLADTYELPLLAGGNGNGGGYPGGGGGGGGGQSRPPNWAVGTWTWQQGPDRQFTIDADGRVTEYTGGRTSYGTYNRGSIFLNGNQSSITRTANGIRTYNTATGETSDYARGAYGGGGGEGYPGGGGGNMTRPPTWAVGTWTWVQGQGRQFTIEANGRIVEYTGGRTNYGSYNNGVMSLNGSTSTITRTRNGIRTYNESTGETSDYVRQ
jgi:hypothetical protein